MSFTVAPYAPRYRDRVLGLMEQVQGHRTSAERFEWEFERNPVADINVFLALHGDDVVGVSCHNTFRMRLEGRDEVVSFPLNVLTRADHRGRGIFSTLEAANEEQAAALGVPLMLSFPNEASSSIFVSRLGWSPLEAPRLLWRPRPRWSGMPGLSLSEVDRFDRWADEAWAASTDLDRCFIRDSAYLNWRFADWPGGGYRVFAARDGAEIVGYAVTGSTVKRGVRVAFVASALLVPEWRGAYAGLRRAALARERGWVALDLEGPLSPAAGGSGPYARLPKRLRLIGKPVADVVDLAWIERAPWFFQLGDLDFF